MTTGTVTGYTYTLSGFRFGFTRQNYLGIDCGKWYSVELTTGYIVQKQTYSTLKSAVLDLMEDLRSEKYRNFLRDFLRDATDINPDLTPRYTIWTARTA
jgi:hypothetical protein